MNRKQLLERAIELKECSEEFESVEFLDSDVEFFANVVEIIQRTAQEVPVQEQSKLIHTLKIYNNKLMLDNFKLQGVKSYKLSHDSKETLSEINITLTVNNSKTDF